MDLNQLLYHHQMALMGARSMPLSPEKMGSFDLAGHYARKIRKMRQQMGIVPHPDWLDADGDGQLTN